MLLPWQWDWLKTRFKKINGFCLIKKNPVVRISSSFAHYKVTWNLFFQHCSIKNLTYAIFVIHRNSFSVVLKVPYVKIQTFCDRSFTWFLNYFLAKFLEIQATSLNFLRNCAWGALNWVPRSIAWGFLRFISFENILFENNQCVNQLIRI